MTTIADLPSEIIFLVFDNLDRRDLYTCALINRQFHAPANSRLWRTVQIYSNPSILCFFKCLKNARSHVRLLIRHIELPIFPWFTQKLKFLLNRASRLETLVLGDSTKEVTISKKHHHPKKWPFIKTLRLKNVRFTSGFVNALKQHCTQMIRLDLIDCPDLPLDKISKLLPVLPLKSFTISFNDQHSVWNNTNTHKMAMALTRLSNLEILKFTYFPSDIFGQIIRTAISTLNEENNIPLWPSLSFLFIMSIFDNITDIVPLLRHCSLGLTRLVILLTTVDNTILDAIATYHPNLKELDISYNGGLTSKGVRRLIRRCPQLTTVSISYTGLTVDDFPEAGQHCLEHISWTSRNTVRFLDQIAIDRIRAKQEP